jgi:signal transduction histidine kinase
VKLVGRVQLTVQGWLILVLSVIGLVVLVGAVAAAVLLVRTDRVSHELSENIQPARVAAYQLQAALRDQETAVRGYVIAADPQFLDPYFDGKRAEIAAADVIRHRVGGRPELIADLDAIEKAAANWRTTYIEPLIATIAPGVPAIVTSAQAELGRSEFDRIRSLFDVQTERMSMVRADSLRDLKQAQAWRNGVLIATLTVFVATAILLAILVRRAITRPLASLAAACRRITGGDFAQTITTQGPKDIRAISADVEDMRRRIVAELEKSQTSRNKLAEQTVELRRSNAELEQFAYVASHDLQEPLRKVASFSQLLERRYGDKLDERGLEYIGFAVDGAKRMQVLINDLLTFSRVGRLNATNTEVALDSMLDAALDNLETAIAEAGAEIVRPEAPLPHVTGDPTLMTMLWQNLIGNAVKFRARDVAPMIVIDCRRTDASPDGHWLFTVSDNGIGIADEFVDQVFVIFQRLRSRDTYSGTGIGLALCKKIVEYHGGVIWLDTSYAGGARFCFTLPIAVTVGRASAPAEKVMHGWRRPAERSTSF